jgi:hypothetical protein
LIIRSADATCGPCDAARASQATGRPERRSRRQDDRGAAWFKTVPDDELDNLLRVAFTYDKLMPILIEVDRGVAHGRVVNIMERAKGVGLTRIYPIGTCQHVADYFHVGPDVGLTSL